MVSAALFGCAADKIADTPPSSNANQRPNIVVILADDLGFGDIGAYNPKSKIPTPSLDSLAQDGMRFTDVHSPSSVCTPTRYSLLTGRYAWRSSLKSGVLYGEAPLLINTERETIPSMLKKQGYQTAAIGKWHLGIGKDKTDYYAHSVESNGAVLQDFPGLRPGPNEVGFDYFFGVPASLDMAPYLYIENGKPVTPLNGTMISAGKRWRVGGEGFWRKGEIADGFTHQGVLPTLTERASNYIAGQSGAATNKPFFLYFALTAPHTPWVATEEFQGKSAAGHYGDFVAQVDDVIRQVEQSLQQAGLADNTLLIVTSDNGAHWRPQDADKYEHAANGTLRGQKADIYEGGHRVPFIAKWKGHIQAGSASDVPATLADLMATFAELTDAEMNADDGPDSYSILPVLLGDDNARLSARPALIHHSFDGMFAIRSGDWKLVEGLGSGGFTKPKRIDPQAGQINVQLYNLRADPLEQNDLAAMYPDTVDMLLKELDEIKNQ